MQPEDIDPLNYYNLIGSHFGLHANDVSTDRSLPFDYQQFTFWSHFWRQLLSPPSRPSDQSTGKLVTQDVAQPSQPSRSAFATLTDQQLAEHQDFSIDTEALARQVSKLLQDRQISQKLFGNLALGLSQGTVSELLSYPRPWNILTAKGRIPYIRMMRFLEDETAFEKLLAGREQAKEAHKLDCNEALAPVPGSTTHPTDILVSHSVDLDTQAIANRVKAILTEHSINQRIFGKVVLNRSQSSVSHLLSNPLPWKQLTGKCRIPFLQMKQWLEDPDNISKLRREQRHERKARHGSIGESSEKPSRFFFSDNQKATLLTVFASNPFPDAAIVEALANQLKVSPYQITNWFQNNRRRQIFKGLGTSTGT